MTPDGVIHQIHRKRFSYSNEYIQERYDMYGELTTRMSYLRLGYVTGVIGRVPVSVLDVGFGNGSFLKLCANILSDVNGYDISGYPIPDRVTRVSSLGEKSVEVATFFDSLEHFDNIDDISQLNCRYIVVSVPWCHYLSDQWFQAWKHRRPDEHLHHFNPKSLQAFMLKHGYEQINYCSIEDVIRKPVDSLPNILTAAFRRCGNQSTLADGR